LSPFRPGAGVAVFALATLGILTCPPARAQSPDSLVLRSPTDVNAWNVYDRTQKRFVVWIKWREASDSLATFIHPPDLTEWAPTSPPASVSQPAFRGAYTGDIDRTILFRNPLNNNATVGVDSVRISYEIRREEFLAGTLVLRRSYVPGTWMRMPFRNRNNGQTVDLGLEVSFGPGVVDAQAGFALGVEDFEGFHIWRGIEPDGRDLTVIGELSKEEAFKGNNPGGSVVDSVYFYGIIPDLRQSLPWFSPFGAVDCLGTRIDLPLESDELFWFDCNAVNGFTYYYAVTTFDRDYNVGSSSQGLVKFDHCTVSVGAAYPCRDEMVSMSMEVVPQNDLYNVYAVPNPYRTGSSRLTSESYHNFPDDKIRFVNVPATCTLKVFTVAGDLVWEVSHNDGSGNIEWDVTNRDSQPVTSGVYMYRVETPDGDFVFGRIVVIR
jgi:hypothetical protein